MNWFTSLAHVNWARFTVVVAATVVFWSGMAAVIPTKVHTYVLVILSAVQSALTFLLRANRYVTREGVPPNKGEIV